MRTEEVILGKNFLSIYLCSYNNLLIFLDLMETTTVLPIHIVASLLLTKYRFSGATLKQLMKDTDIVLEKLKAMQK